MVDIVNFLDETKEKLEENHRKPEEIIFIGIDGGKRNGESCSWTEFVIMANFKYDSGYGGNVINLHLVIHFDDGAVMRRVEYDGSEWWDYYSAFVLPKEKKSLLFLTEIEGFSDCYDDD